MNAEKAKEQLQLLLNAHSNSLFKQALEASGDRAEARQTTVDIFKEIYALMLREDTPLDYGALLFDIYARRTAAEPLTAEAPAEPLTAEEPEAPANPLTAEEPEAPAAPSYYVRPAEPVAAPAPAAESIMDDEDDDVITPADVGKSRPSVGATLAVVLMTAVVVWVIIGVMGGYGIITPIDLGYKAIGFYNLPIF